MCFEWMEPFRSENDWLKIDSVKYILSKRIVFVYVTQRQKPKTIFPFIFMIIVDHAIYY